MSDVYQCDGCQPACILVAQADDMPVICPFKTTVVFKAEWRQIQ